MKKLQKSLIALSIFLCCTDVAIGQQSLFRDGDRIAFIGSSIAMKGGNFHYINLFYATRYPGTSITSLNGGIDGDITNGIIERMDEDILSQKPTWVIMMLEENDLQVGLYYKSRQGEEGIAEKRHQWLNNWLKNADSIIRILKKANVKIILETPSIYDQTGNLPVENGYGVNDSLQKCAAYLKQLAKKYDLPLVDCWTILNDVNKIVQQKDITNSIIGNDRVHISPMGYFVMAYEFLKSIPANPIVSKTVIDSRNSKIMSQENCSVTNLKTSAAQLQFLLESNSLPFPSPEGVNVDSFFSFSTELNSEILRVKKMKKGNYQLIIDENNVGIFSANELKKGINLSLYKNTPQYVQASRVLALFEEYWKLEYSLRRLKFIEYNYLGKLQNKDNPDEVQKAFDEVLDRFKQKEGYNYLKNTFAEYKANKPVEKDLVSKSDSLLHSIRSISMPAGHQYKITRL
ncbi:MAG: SGNH/GDSL hydrolase family protein [Bacteroidetes bacterium]|nr:SGNH/GDSL hydrolase family protein [Bacteroidota bacterium]